MIKIKKLEAWVKEVQELCQPDRVYWCDGSEEENQRLLDEMVKSGMAVPLKKRPGSYLSEAIHLTLRVEENLYCTKSKDDAGPTNNWIDPDRTEKTMTELYKGV